MSKLKESQMQEWLNDQTVILQHLTNEDDSVLRIRARAVERSSSKEETIKMIEGWLACDQAHSSYTGL